MSVDSLSLEARILVENIKELNPATHSINFIRWRLDVFKRAAYNVPEEDRNIVLSAIIKKRIDCFQE